MEFSMNKLALSAVAIVVSTLAVSPKITSNYIEQNTLDIVSSIDALPLYQAEVITSDFGWFKSSAKVKVKADMAQLVSGTSSDEVYAMDLVLNFNHGLLTTSGANLSDFAITVENLPGVEGLSWDKSLPLYQVNGQVSLIGNLSYDDELPQISYTSEGGIEVNVSSYRGHAETVNGILKHTGLLPNLVLNFPQLTMQVKDININTLMSESITSYFDDNTVPVYDSSLEVTKWTVNSPDTFDATMDNLSMSVSSSVDEEKHLVFAKLAYGLEQVKVNDYVGSDFELVFETNNLDENTYIKFNKLLAAQSGPQQPTEQLETMASFLRDNLLDILSPAPEMNITSFKGKLPQGNFDANLHAKIENVKEAPSELMAPPFWLSHLNASSDVKVAKPLAHFVATQIVRNQLVANPNFVDTPIEEVEKLAAQQAPLMISMFEAQGLIVPDENSYTLNFELANNVAKLNGNEVPLPQ